MKPLLTAIVAITALLATGACGGTNASRALLAPTTPAPTTPAAPTPSTGTTSPIPITLGETVTGSTHQRTPQCIFRASWGGYGGANCEVYEVAVTAPGMLTVATTSSGTLLVVFLKGTDGSQIEVGCCSGSLRAPVEASTYRIEVVAQGTQVPSSFQLTTAWQPRDGLLTLLRARVFIGDDAHRVGQIANARVEIVDGSRAGALVPFDPATSLYELKDVAPGYITLHAAADGFEPITSRVLVGVNEAGSVTLHALVPFTNPANVLQGWVWDRANPNLAYDDAKIEILDGPLAGVFTFSLEDWGSYEMPALPTGVIHLRASSHGRSDTQAVTVSGQTRLDFRLAAN